MLSCVCKSVRSLLPKALKPRALPLRLVLEGLESRELWALYVWTGGAGTANPNWSAPANWAVGGNVATTEPGSDDDVKFDGAGAPGSEGELRDSTVDATFGGTIRKLTVEAGYTKTITLNRDLVVNTAGARTSE